MRSLVLDIVYAWRTFRRDRVLTGASLVCLALGIGATTSVFSAANALLFRALPVSAPERLVAIHRTTRSVCCSENSYPIFEDLQRQTSVFSSVEAHYPLLAASLKTRGEPARVWGQVVSPNYFDVLGIRTTLGRPLLAGRDVEPAGAPAVVIAHSLWQRDFASAPEAIGATVRINGHPFTVVGVAPQDFRGVDLGLSPQFWVPISAIDQAMPQRPGLDDRTAPWLLINARLKPGVDRVRAQAALQVLSAQLAGSHPQTDRERGFLLEPAGAFHPAYRGLVVSFVAICGIAVALVLAVAAINVGNLLLARASARSGEIALRLALGAGRGRLVRQMLVESTLLAAVGGAAGVAVAWAAVKLLAAVRLPLAVPLSMEVPIDARALAFAVAVSAAAGLLFGLAPAFHFRHADLASGLKSGRLGVRSTRVRLGDILLALQIAASVLVLICAGLFFRSFGKVANVSPGFRTDHLLLMNVDPRLRGNPERLMPQIRERVASAPGVVSATFSDFVPLGFSARAANVAAAGRDPVRADTYLVGGAYFDTMGIPILRGRDLAGAGERAGTAIVNNALARRLWPGESAVGRRFVRGGTSYEVVGVAADVKSRSLWEQQRFAAYFPFEKDSGATPFGMTLLVRTQSDGGGVLAAIQERIRSVDPDMAISDIRTIEQQVANALYLPRLGAAMFGVFGAVALLLTSAGLYGLISYSVNRRTRELGIRAALGAGRRDLLVLVMGRAARLALAGICAGSLAAVAVGRGLSGLLFGVSAMDPLTFALVPAATFAIALAASYAPARNGSTVAPALALRHDI
jgi:predicted permease